jgi:NAD(P)H dehydrogenase (quinone)
MGASAWDEGGRCDKFHHLRKPTHNQEQTMSTIAVVYHSMYGHTKLQAEAVLRGAQAVPDVSAQLYTVEEATARMDELDEADAIIFGCPTYMGSMSAGMKQFIEAAATKWFKLAWKDKIAGAFTNSSSFSGDKLNTLLGLVVNAMQHGMIYVGLGLMPSANRPDEMNTTAGPGPEAHNRVGSFTGPMASSFQVHPPGAPPGEIETAELYGKRVAQITATFLKGRG